MTCALGDLSPGGLVSTQDIGALSQSGCSIAADLTTATCTVRLDAEAADLAFLGRTSGQPAAAARPATVGPAGLSIAAIADDCHRPATTATGQLRGWRVPG